MALRRRGKKGTYHAYYRTVMARPDGTLKYASVTVNLGTTDKHIAEALEAELMAKNEAARNHQRTQAHLIRLEIAAGRRPPEDLPVITRDHRRKRVKLADAPDLAAKYRKLGDTTVKLWKRFAGKVRCRYMDEVTPEIAFKYLDEFCNSGKAFNNTRSALHTVFRLTLLEAGIEDSPFAKIPNRKLDSQHQRPFTEAEFKQIYSAAPEPWKTASLIAWFTGLRKKDVFNLRWTDISGDVITITPAKTSRFGRAVRIPIHPQLAAALDDLPRKGKKVLDCFEFDEYSYNYQFTQLLKQFQIAETQEGIVSFNSFRNSFITRCDSAGIPRHAIRGIVGHMEDQQTDLYSHDLSTARLVQQLPEVDLDKLVCLEEKQKN